MTENIEPIPSEIVLEFSTPCCFCAPSHEANNYFERLFAKVLCTIIVAVIVYIIYMHYDGSVQISNNATIFEFINSTTTTTTIRSLDSNNIRNPLN